MRFFFFTPFFFSLTKLINGIGPRTLCNACGLVYAKLVRILHGTEHPFLLILIIITDQKKI